MMQNYRHVLFVAWKAVVLQDASVLYARSLRWVLLRHVVWRCTRDMALISTD